MLKFRASQTNEMGITLRLFLFHDTQLEEEVKLTLDTMS